MGTNNLQKIITQSVGKVSSIKKIGEAIEDGKLYFLNDNQALVKIYPSEGARRSFNDECALSFLTSMI